jgi:hypothetical protein
VIAGRGLSRKRKGKREETEDEELRMERKWRGKAERRSCTISLEKMDRKGKAASDL